MLEFVDSSIKREVECPEHLISPRDTHSWTAFLHVKMAKHILLDIMKFRRIAVHETNCELSPCEKCLEPHLSKIVLAVEQSRPVTLVLPAFPGKSPNQAKVLGTLPDMAERRALEFLQRLCDQVKQYYSPGVHIILCSDGRVFSDVVGMCDKAVSAYRTELSRIINESGFTSLSTVDLDDLYVGLDFGEMRAKLMEQYGESLENIKSAVSRGKSNDSSVDDREANRLYCGITRFLVEDAMVPGQTQSKTAIQKECRIRAYSVIQRSKAWGNWVESRFPQAVRLSIHPQTCGSKKLGIRLIEPDNWMTPWHGVAVDVSGRYMLLKRSQAEQIGARLVHMDGRPSHYILSDEKESTNLQGAENGA